MEGRPLSRSVLAIPVPESVDASDSAVKDRILEAMGTANDAPGVDVSVSTDLRAESDDGELVLYPKGSNVPVSALQDEARQGRINKAVNRLGELDVEFSGGVEGLTLAELWDRWNSEDVQGINVGDRNTANFPETGGAIVTDESGVETRFAQTLSTLEEEAPGTLKQFDTTDVGGDPELAERMQARRDRREIREAAREQIEADPDVSLDDVSIDARAGDDPAIVFQDPDTGETERVSLEAGSPEAAADAVDSFDPSDAGGATSPTTTGSTSDGIDSRVIAAGAAVIGLLLYGATA